MSPTRILLAIVPIVAVAVAGCAFWSAGMADSGSATANARPAAYLVAETRPVDANLLDADERDADESLESIGTLQASQKPTGRVESKQADPPNRLKLFRDWPTPDAVIVFSGQQHGYLEPCGCSPQFQKGGLARRLGFVNSLRQQKWPLVLADLGGILDDHTQQLPEGKLAVGQEQSLAKLEIAFEALQHMGYTAVNFSSEELGVPNGFIGLMGTLININNPPQPRLLNANLEMTDQSFIDEGLLLRSTTRLVGNTKIAFVGVVGEKHKERLNDPEIKSLQTPDHALRSSLGKLIRESDLQVLLLAGDFAEAQRLAKSFPELDVIIHGHDAEEPTGRPEWLIQVRMSRNKVGFVSGSDGKNIRRVEEETGAKIELNDDGSMTVSSTNAAAADKAVEQVRLLAKVPSLDKLGKTMLVTIGKRGKYTGTIGLFSKGDTRARFELVPLDDRFDDDKDIRELLDVKYMQKLAALDLVKSSPKVPYPDGPELSFAGSEACKTCHPTVFAKWSSTRHAHALDTLVNGVVHNNKKIAGGKHVNPECINCHVTGFPYKSGFDGSDATKHLFGNGCENCHGPASEHVAVYRNLQSTKEEQKRANRRVHRDPQTDEKHVCARCHDFENDPGFKLDERWPEVEHGVEAGEDQKLWPKIREKLGRKE